MSTGNDGQRRSTTAESDERASATWAERGRRDYRETIGRLPWQKKSCKLSLHAESRLSLPALTEAHRARIEEKKGKSAARPLPSPPRGGPDVGTPALAGGPTSLGGPGRGPASQWTQWTAHRRQATARYEKEKLSNCSFLLRKGNASGPKRRQQSRISPNYKLWRRKECQNGRSHGS
jgi:hypothetical protein